LYVWQFTVYRLIIGWAGSKRGKKGTEADGRNRKKQRRADKGRLQA
jgi:hypothetical protein